MNSWLSDAVVYNWQIAKLESLHWGVVIYNQIVTRTAFAFLAMFNINIQFKTSHEGMACCYLIFGRVRTLPKRLSVKKVPPLYDHKEQHDQWSLTTSWDCNLFKLRSKYSTWWDSLKFTSSGKSEALKQMGVELIIRGPSKPSVEFCHIVLIGIGRPQLWSHLRFLHFIPRTKLWKWIKYKVDNFTTINWGQRTLLLTSTFYIYALYQFVFRAS